MNEKVTVPILKDGVFTGNASSDIDSRIKKSVNAVDTRLSAALVSKVDTEEFAKFTNSAHSSGHISGLSVQAGMVRVAMGDGEEISAPLPNARTYSPITYFWADWYNGEKSKWLKATEGMPVGYVILNISNGSGAKVDPDFTEQVRRVRTTGARILGYVRTDYGRRAQEEVFQEIRNHVSWYQVDGVFLDEALNGWGDQEPMVSSQVKLYEDIKKEFGAGFTVVTNPGANTVQALVDASDIQMCFESYAETYLTTTLPDFYAKYPAHRFWHVVHDVTPDNYRDVLARADKLGAGHLYITDDRFIPSPDPQTPSENPYDGVPSKYLLEAQRYWTEGLGDILPIIHPPAGKKVPLALTLGSAHNATFTKTSATWRVPLFYSAEINTWRLHIRNINYITGDKRSAPLRIDGIWLGDNAGNGKYAAAPVKLSEAFEVPANGGEYVSSFFTAPIGGLSEKLLEFSYSNAAEAPVALHGGSWHVTAGRTADVSQTPWASASTPLDIWIEAIVSPRVKIVGAYGDSLSVGFGARLPIHDSAISQYARENRALPVHYAASGDTMANWNKDPQDYRWSRWDGFAKVDEMVFAMGSNDVFFNMSLATLQSRFEASMKILSDKVSPSGKIYLTSILPRTRATDSGNATPEAIRRQYNAWLKKKGQVADYAGYLDFVTVASADDETLKADLDADGIHLKTAGYKLIADVIARSA